MPLYEYRCKECGKEFTLRLRISEHEKKKPRCPKCGSRKLEQQYSFFAKTAKKS